MARHYRCTGTPLHMPPTFPLCKEATPFLSAPSALNSIPVRHPRPPTPSTRHSTMLPPPSDAPCNDVHQATTAYHMTFAQTFATSSQPPTTTPFLKVTTSLAEPTQWRGTIVTPIPRNAHTFNLTDATPAHLACAYAKTQHRYQRDHLIACLQDHSRQTPCGGIATRATEFPTHALREITNLARWQNRGSMLAVLSTPGADADTNTRSHTQRTTPSPAKY